MARRDDPDRTKVVLADPWMGTVVADRYRLELRIAGGGFGAIYRALDLATDHDVAVKLLHPRLASAPEAIARFRREGDALAQLRDPHTVAAFDVGETADGVLYIAMELLAGPSLHTVLREQGPLPWRRVAAIARAVCSSLGEAHALGIVHRDLKPSNIHLEPGDIVKVLDFGIAKIAGGADLTGAGQMIGTWDYMAPEQMVGGETTGKTDVFTLGIVMYELLVGERPFGDAPTASAILAAMLGEPPRSPAQRGAEVPPDLDRAITRCLAQKAAERPTVEAIADLLERLLDVDEERTHVEPVNRFASGEHTVIDPGAFSSAERTVDERTVHRTDRFAPFATLPGVAPPKKTR